MAIGCGPKLSKCILILFNLMFWLSGLIMIIVAAIYMSNVAVKYIDNIAKTSTNRSLLIGLLTLGIIIFLIAFCGCCGAIKESKMLLGIYILFLVLIIFVQLAIGILAIVYKNTAEESFSESFKTELQFKYGNDSDVTKLIDGIQENLLCCGVGNKDDWQQSSWFKANNQRYPNSCCKTNNITCSNENIKDVHDAGCQEKLKENMGKFAPIIIGVVLGIAFFEIFVVICAFCLCRSTGTLSETV